MLSRLNDYYEANNLKAISVKAMNDQMKDIEKLVETKSSMLELKKVIS